MNAKKSVNKNLVLNFVRTGMSLIFPLISFPYISRVLSPAGIGMANYSNSIVTYFVLIAGLGVSSYAIREGSPIRNNKEEFSNLANELFSLNLVTTIISYVFLFLMVLFVPQFQAYQLAITIYSATIFFKTIGVEWIFNICEDYFYITLRSTIFQFISLLLMLLLVRSVDDTYIYIAIVIFSGVGSNILNFIYARKYWNIKIILNKKIFHHLKPILIIFSTTLATTIYSTADVTMLGWMIGDTDVGIYSVATKLYNILKSMINSIVVVFSPRTMYLIVNDKKEYQRTFQYAFDIVMFFCIPIVFGVFFFSKDIILIISGPAYNEAAVPMSIITASLIFSCLGNLLSSGALLAIRKEKLMLVATSIGCVLNIVLNAILIPYYKSAGAAFATLVTEVTICTVLFICFKKNIKMTLAKSHTLKCIFASLLFVVVKICYSQFLTSSIINSVFAIGFCAVLYCAVLVLLKDEFIMNIIGTCLKKIKTKKRVG